MAPQLLSLSDEALLIIYRFADYEHLLGGLSQTCRRLHQLSKVNSLWTVMCEPIYKLMGMKRQSWKDISDQQEFYYDQMRTRGRIYTLLDVLVAGGSLSVLSPCDDSYTTYRYSLIREICKYKEKAIPSLYPICTSDPVKSPYSLTHQFYAKSILAVIVKLRALEVLKRKRFSGYCLFEFVLAVRDLCSDSLNYELLELLDDSTLDNMLETVCLNLGVQTSEISEKAPTIIAKVLIRFMSKAHYLQTLGDDLKDCLNPLFIRTGSAALYTHFARHLGLNACTAVLKSWTCVLITDESGNRFVVNVEQDWVKPAVKVPEVSTITQLKLNSIINKADERLAGMVCSVFAKTPTFLIIPREQLVLYGLRNLFRIGSKRTSISPEVFTEIPLHVLVLEKMHDNPSSEVKDLLHQTLKAPGETIKSRRFLAKDVKFKVGQICTLKEDTSRLGVVVGWHLNWNLSGTPEVHYKWLIQNKEESECVPEWNLEELSPMPVLSSLCTSGAVADYTKLGEYFMRFDEQSIEPNSYLSYIYPDDVSADEDCL